MANSFLADFKASPDKDEFIASFIAEQYRRIREKKTRRAATPADQFMMLLRLELLKNEDFSDDEYYKKSKEAVMSWQPSEDRKYYGYLPIFKDELLKVLEAMHERQKLIKKLNTICDDYLTHLENKNDSIAVEKKKIMHELKYKLDIKNPSRSISEFAKHFEANKNILEKSRDSSTRNFIKKVLTVISFGLASALGMWNIKGKAVSKAINDEVIELRKKIK